MRAATGQPLAPPPRLKCMIKTTPLGIRLEPDMHEALARAARDDARSMSAMAVNILADWLREHGYLMPRGIAAIPIEELNASNDK
jgi:hypothetical protein